MITIGDALLKLGLDTSDFKGQVAGINRLAEDTANGVSEQFGKIGSASLGIGGAITGAFALSAKSAADEEEAMLRLGNTLSNLNINFEDVKKPLDGFIMGLEKATATSHDELYAALNQLLNITGDYNQSLKLLPVALDLAKGASIDLATAAKLVGKVEEGNNSLLARYGIIVKEGATQTEVLDAITKRFGGSAAAMGNSTKSAMEKVKLSLEALMENIGSIFLPLLKSVSGVISTVIGAVKTWTEQHPLLTKVIVGVTAVLGLLLLGLGTYVTLSKSATVQTVLHLAKLGLMAAATGVATAAQWLWNAALSANPIGLVIIGVTALIAAGIALWKNWDKVVRFFKDAWSVMKIAVLTGVDAILGGLGKFLGWIPGLGEKIDAARDKIRSMIDAEKVSKDARTMTENVEDLAVELTETIRAEIEKRRDAELADIEIRRGAAKKELDDSLAAINKKYGVLEDKERDLTVTELDQARQRTNIAKEEVDKEITLARKAYDKKIELLNKEREAKLDAFDDEVSAQEKAIQDQIDAIDAQTAAEDLSLTRQGEKNRLSELQAAIDSADTDEARAEAKEAFAEYSTQVNRNELLRRREDQKDALQNEIDGLREAAKSERTILETKLTEEYDAKKAAAEKELEEITIPSLNEKKKELDKALAQELIDIDSHRMSLLTAEGQKYTNSEGTGIFDLMDKEKTEKDAFYAAQLTDIALHVAAINAATAQLQDRVITITTKNVTVESDDGSDTNGTGNISPEEKAARSGGAGASGPQQPWVPRLYDKGGIIPGPTLLSSLPDLRPYAFAAMNGIPERVTPMGQTPSILITGNTFNVRKDDHVNEIGEKLVNLIRLKGGLRL